MAEPFCMRNTILGYESIKYSMSLVYKKIPLDNLVRAAVQSVIYMHSLFIGGGSDISRFYKRHGMNFPGMRSIHGPSPAHMNASGLISWRNSRVLCGCSDCLPPILFSATLTRE